MKKLSGLALAFAVLAVATPAQARWESRSVLEAYNYTAYQTQTQHYQVAVDDYAWVPISSWEAKETITSSSNTVIAMTRVATDSLAVPTGVGSKMSSFYSDLSTSNNVSINGSKVRALMRADSSKASQATQAGSIGSLASGMAIDLSSKIKANASGSAKVDESTKESLLSIVKKVIPKIKNDEDAKDWLEHNTVNNQLVIPVKNRHDKELVEKIKKEVEHH